MKIHGLAALIATCCLTLAGCSDSADTGMTPDELHEACIAVFETKGGPPELAQQMCESMKEACESDIASDACKQAQRMVENG